MKSFLYVHSNTKLLDFHPIVSPPEKGEEMEALALSPEVLAEEGQLCLFAEFSGGKPLFVGASFHAADVGARQDRAYVARGKGETPVSFTFVTEGALPLTEDLLKEVYEAVLSPESVWEATKKTTPPLEGYLTASLAEERRSRRCPRWLAFLLPLRHQRRFDTKEELFRTFASLLKRRANGRFVFALAEPTPKMRVVLAPSAAKRGGDLL